MVEKAEIDRAENILAVINISNQAWYQSIIPKEYFNVPYMTFDTLVEQFATMTFYCYTQDEAIHGVIALQKDDEETGRIANLYVLPTTQRHGIGTALMRYAHEEARARGLRRLRLHVVEQGHGQRVFIESWATRV